MSAGGWEGVQKEVKRGGGSFTVTNSNNRLSHSSFPWHAATGLLSLLFPAKSSLDGGDGAGIGEGEGSGKDRTGFALLAPS